MEADPFDHIACDADSQSVIIHVRINLSTEYAENAVVLGVNLVTLFHKNL